jgi:hypothetical protein
VGPNASCRQKPGFSASIVSPNVASFRPIEFERNVRSGFWVDWGDRIFWLMGDRIFVLIGAIEFERNVRSGFFVDGRSGFFVDRRSGLREMCDRVFGLIG